MDDLSVTIERFDTAGTTGYDTAELKQERALALLLCGDLASGFEEYHWR